MAKIALSILTSDFLNLKKLLRETKQVDMLHLDIMDGKFAKNLTFGPIVIKSIQKYTNLPLDIHLMIEKPEETISQYIELAPYLITFHYESTKKHIDLIKKIKDSKILSGIAINPETTLQKIIPFLKFIDVVLIMSVNPGLGGQKFLPHSVEKVKEIKKYLTQKKLNPLIEVDGGVNNQNITQLLKAGVDIFVCGSYIVNSSNPKMKIKEIKEMIK